MISVKHKITSFVTAGLMLFSQALIYPLEAAAADTIDLPITKNWVDAGFESQRPDSVTIELYDQSDPSVTLRTFTMSSSNAVDDNTWKTTITGLPKTTSGGDLIKYAVREQPIDGYITKYYGNPEKGTVLTMGENTEYSDQPNAACLYRVDEDGSIYAYSSPVNNSTETSYGSYNGQFYWQVLFEEGLTKTSPYFIDISGYNIYLDDDHFIKAYDPEHGVYSGQSNINYFLKYVKLPQSGRDFSNRGAMNQTLIDCTDGSLFETRHNAISADVDIPVYKYKFNPNDTSTYYFVLDSESWYGKGINVVKETPNEITEITNIYSKRTIPVSKTWNDAGFEDVRPSQITLDLYRDGVKFTETQVTAANNWQGAFTDLDRFAPDGHEYIYSIREQAVTTKNNKASYKTEGRAVNESGTPYYNGLKIRINENFDPQSYIAIFNMVGNDLYYKYNGQNVDGSTYRGSVMYLPLKDFYLGFQSAHDDAVLDMTITPAHVPDEEMYYWTNPSISPEFAYFEPITNDMRHYSDRDRDNPVYECYDEIRTPAEEYGGTPYSRIIMHYFSTETAIGYNESYTSESFTASNSMPTISFPVRKEWNDSGLEHLRPEKVTFQLCNSKGEVVAEHDVTGSPTSDTWNYTFTNIPKYGADGNVENYYVKEKNPSKNYTVNYDHKFIQSADYLKIHFNNLQYEREPLNTYNYNQWTIRINTIQTYLDGERTIYKNTTTLKNLFGVFLKNQRDTLYIPVNKFSRLNDMVGLQIEIVSPSSDPSKTATFDSVDISFVDGSEMDNSDMFNMNGYIDRTSTVSTAFNEMTENTMFTVSSNYQTYKEPNGANGLSQKYDIFSSLFDIEHYDYSSGEKPVSIFTTTQPYLGANTVTNTAKAIDFPIEKSWKADDAQIPDEITLELYDANDPTKTIKTLTINKADHHTTAETADATRAELKAMAENGEYITDDGLNWKSCFYDLPEYDENNNKIQYAIREKNTDSHFVAVSDTTEDKILVMEQGSKIYTSSEAQYGIYLFKEMSNGDVYAYKTTNPSGRFIGEVPNTGTLVANAFADTENAEVAERAASHTPGQAFDLEGLQIFFNDAHFVKIYDKATNTPTDSTTYNKYRRLTYGGYSSSAYMRYYESSGDEVFDTEDIVPTGMYCTWRYKFNETDDETYVLDYNTDSWQHYHIGFDKPSFVQNKITNVYNKNAVTVTKVWDDAGFEDRRYTPTVELYRDGVKFAEKTVEDLGGGVYGCIFSDIDVYAPGGDHKYIYTVKEKPREQADYIKGGYKVEYETDDVTNYYNGMVIKLAEGSVMNCSATMYIKGLDGNYYTKSYQGVSEGYNGAYLCIPSTDFYWAIDGSSASSDYLDLDVEYIAPMHFYFEDYDPTKYGWQESSESTLLDKLKGDNYAWYESNGTSANLGDKLTAYLGYNNRNSFIWHHTYDMPENTVVLTESPKAVSITNTYETINVPFIKTWNGYLVIPENLTVSVFNKLAPNTALKTAVITANDDWKYTFTDLPKYNTDGSIAEYIVKEGAVPRGTAQWAIGPGAQYAGIRVNLSNLTFERDGYIQVGISNGYDDSPQGIQYTFMGQITHDGTAHNTSIYVPLTGNKILISGYKADFDASFEYVTTPTAKDLAGPTAVNRTNFKRGQRKYYPITDFSEGRTSDGIKYYSQLEAGNGISYRFMEYDLGDIDRPLAGAVNIINNAEKIKVHLSKKWDDNNISALERITNIRQVYFEVYDSDTGNVALSGAFINPTLPFLGEPAISQDEALNIDWIRTYISMTNYSLDGVFELPKYNGTKEIKYAIRETQAPQTTYSVLYDGEAAITQPMKYYFSSKTTPIGENEYSLAITNKAEVTEVKYQKKWQIPRQSDMDKKQAVTIALYADGVKLHEATVNDEIVHTYSNLPKYNTDGQLITYTVKEIYDGEVLENNTTYGNGVYKVTYSTGNGTTIITNSVKPMTIYIDKLDEETHERLVDAVLAVYDSTGREVTRWTTDGTKKTIQNLENGTYTIKELKAARGYNTGRDVTFTVTGDTDEKTINFFNNKGILMAETGGEGTTVFYISGILCLLASLFVLRKRD